MNQLGRLNGSSSYRIVFIHLLNDFSGSSKVLRETIRIAIRDLGKAKLYYGSSGEGFLSNCGIPTMRYGYRRTGIRWMTFVTYFFSQIGLFYKLLRDRTIDRDAVIYVNTLLPFGGALYGRLTGRKVIYHLHEISIAPKLLKSILVAIARRTSNTNLYVSDAHMRALPIEGVPASRIHNALDADFLQEAADSTYAHRRNGCFNVLMIASMRDYKGVPELLDLAESLLGDGTIRFDLVANDDRTAIDRYLAGRSSPPNLVIHPQTADTASFYARASLVLNLSRVDQVIETFGLTILEAMAFGIPVISPPVGGPAELVTDGVQGFLVDSREAELLRERVVKLGNNSQLCSSMSQAARLRAREFSHDLFAEQIVEAIR